MAQSIIVVLVFGNNPCYRKVISVAEAQRKFQTFAVDAQAGQWSFAGKEYTIGRTRSIELGRKGDGPISVFSVSLADEKETIHDLNTVLFHAEQAGGDHTLGYDDL